MDNFGNLSNRDMSEYRYKLEKGSRKHYCPECKKKRFVRYTDTLTGEYLPEKYGRCDREANCGYHLNPYSDGYTKKSGEGEMKADKIQGSMKAYSFTQPKPQQESETVYFDKDTFRQTLGNYDKNTFIQNLFQRVSFPFEADDVAKVIQLYGLGTVSHGYRAGAVTFPFIDVQNNVRAIQVKQFDEQNHTRSTDFLHSILEKHYTNKNKPMPKWLEEYQKQDKRITCLFGEHLLVRYPHNPIALVEAPKTAVYGTLYFGLPESPDDLIWLAVYNKSSFSYDKLKVLQGRFVFVFPDLSSNGSTFKEWETKAKEYERRLPGTKFVFSNLLERHAPEQDKSNGYDLADYLIKQDWRLFRKQAIKEQAPAPSGPEVVTKVTEVTPEKNFIFSGQEATKQAATPTTVTAYENNLWKKKEATKQRKSWSKEIAGLETYFASVKLPSQNVKLNQCSTIMDCSKFIENHLSIVKGNNGNDTFLPYLQRLFELKEALARDII